MLMLRLKEAVYTHVDAHVVGSLQRAQGGHHFDQKFDTIIAAMWIVYISADAHVVWSLQRARSLREGTSHVMPLKACIKKDVQKHGSRFGQKFDTTIALTFLAEPRGEVDLSIETSFRIASRTNHLEANNTLPSRTRSVCFTEFTERSSRHSFLYCSR